MKLDLLIRGATSRTILRGQTVMAEGQVVGKPGFGKYLGRFPGGASALP